MARIINFLNKRVKLPNGNYTDLQIIKHPGASLIVPFLNRDKVIILRQFRPVIGIYLYELPAGTLKDNETPLSCARREIIEETGYGAGRFTRLGMIFPVPGYSTEKITVFRADRLKKKRINLEKDEIITTRVVTRKQIRGLFKKGKIIDSKTICAFSMCGWL